MHLVSINKLFPRWLLLFLSLRTVVDSNSVTTANDDVIVGEPAYMGHTWGHMRTSSHRMNPVDEAQWHRNRRRPTAEVNAPMQDRPWFPKPFNRKRQRSPYSNAVPWTKFESPNDVTSDLDYNRPQVLPDDDSLILKPISYTKVHVSNVMWKETSPMVSLKADSTPHVDQTVVDDTLHPKMDTTKYTKIPFENSDLGNATMTERTTSNADIMKSIVSKVTIVNRVLTNLTLINLEVDGPSRGEIIDWKINSTTIGNKTYQNITIQHVDVISHMSNESVIRNLTIINATLVNGNVTNSGKTVVSTKVPDTNDTCINLTSSKVTISSDKTRNKSVAGNKSVANETNPNLKLNNTETGNATKLYATFANVTINHVNLVNATQTTIGQILNNKTDQVTFANITIYNVTISNASVIKENVIDGIITKICVGNKTFLKVKVKHLVKGKAIAINRTIPDVTITQITLKNGKEITSGKIVNQYLNKKRDEVTLKNITESDVTINNVERSFGNVTIVTKVVAGNKTYHNISEGNSIHLNVTGIKHAAIITRNMSRPPDKNKAMTNLTISRIKITNLKIDKGRMTNGLIANVTIGKTTYKNLKITNANIHTAVMVDGTIYNATIVNATITNGMAITSGIITSETDANTTIINQSRWKTTNNKLTTVTKKLVSGVSFNRTIGNNAYLNVKPTNITKNIRNFSKGIVKSAKLMNCTNTTVDKGGLFVNMIWPCSTNKPNVLGVNMSMNFNLNSTKWPFQSDAINDSTKSTFIHGHKNITTVRSTATNSSVTITTVSTVSSTHLELGHISTVDTEAID